MKLNDGTLVRFDEGDDGVQRVVLIAPDEAKVVETAEPGDYLSPFPVYYAFTRRDPRTIAGSPKNAQWSDVSSSPFAYCAALCKWWETAVVEGTDLAIVEHDVVCRPDIIETFVNCPEPWCSFTYADICCQDENGWSPCMEAWRNMIGCTRFRAELIADVPNAVSAVPAHCPDSCTEHGPAERDQHWDWHLICNQVLDNVRAAGYQHHWHWPGAEHHHFAQ